jgi:hypothetical protein
MLDPISLTDFSRTHCAAICTVLVPANLTATLQTLLFAGFQRPAKQLHLMAVVSCGYALIMILHVATWLMIGVVMIPTFILLGLGSLCLGINGWAIASPMSFMAFLHRLRSLCIPFTVPKSSLKSDQSLA